MAMTRISASGAAASRVKSPIPTRAPKASSETPSAVASSWARCRPRRLDQVDAGVVAVRTILGTKRLQVALSAEQRPDNTDQISRLRSEVTCLPPQSKSARNGGVSLAASSTMSPGGTPSR